MGHGYKTGLLSEQAGDEKMMGEMSLPPLILSFYFHWNLNTVELRSQAMCLKILCCGSLPLHFQNIDLTEKNSVAVIDCDLNINRI